MSPRQSPVLFSNRSPVLYCTVEQQVTSIVQEQITAIIENQLSNVQHSRPNPFYVNVARAPPDSRPSNLSRRNHRPSRTRCTASQMSLEEAERATVMSARVRLDKLSRRRCAKERKEAAGSVWQSHSHPHHLSRRE